MKLQIVLLVIAGLLPAIGAEGSELHEASKKTFCPDKLQAVYADMHDGDKKEVTISGDSLTIKPSGNDEQWVVNAKLDLESCSANVDFNVPGKPNPPPVPLTATLWYSFSEAVKKTEFEFTDPSGKIAAKGFPVNNWVELKNDFDKKLPVPCPTSLKAVYADIHDGDRKELTISGTALTIKPSGNKQSWEVKAQVDSKSCSATIDFHVPGKPNPPPVSLRLAFFYTVSAETKKTEFEFTDPSGKLAAAGFPLNHWLEISKVSEQSIIYS